MEGMTAPDKKLELPQRGHPSQAESSFLCLHACVSQRAEVSTSSSKCPRTGTGKEESIGISVQMITELGPCCKVLKMMMDVSSTLSCRLGLTEQAGGHLELLRVEWKFCGRRMNLTAGCRWITGGETKEGRGEGRLTLKGGSHYHLDHTRMAQVFLLNVIISNQKNPLHPILLCVPFSSVGIMTTHPEY